MGKIDSIQSTARRGFLRRCGAFLIRNPVSRILIGLPSLAIGASLVESMFRPFQFTKGQPLDAGPLLLHILTSFSTAAVAILLYVGFVRLLEHRYPCEISLRRLPGWLSLGLVTGGILYALSVLSVWALGGLNWGELAPANQWIGLITLAVSTQLAVATFEEVLIRGILFRIVEESLGSWPAVGLSAALFGLLHLGNENASWVVAAGLAVQAGVLLATAYMVSRSLWMPIGIHWGWNAVQAGVVGGTVSGQSTRVVVSLRPAGSDIISGGAFGIEGSLVTTFICAAGGVILYGLAVRLGRVRPGFWARRQVANAELGD